jgi:hypothetical protein
MKRIFTILMVLGCMFGKGIAQECEIPPNYFQNPNFEHKLSPLVWTGAFDWISWGAWQPYSHPEFWVTDTTETHSGSKCLVITADSWIWPGVSTIGFEEKSMKMSFWYKAPLGKMAFWMFFYRDALLTPEEIRAPLTGDLVGADTAYITLTAGTTDEEALYFEMPAAADWTYFEFKFDFPGTIPGPQMTLMFWSEQTVGFIDDAYYGVDFDCVYNGEEEIGIVNPDFEAEGFGAEWLIETPAAMLPEFLSNEENHTDGGVQSMVLWKEHTATYYLPVLGTEGQDLDLNFWYKGNEGTVQLNFYEDYDITTNEFEVPEGAELIVDSIPEYVEAVVDTTIIPLPIYDHSVILQSFPTGDSILVIDIANVLTDTVALQDFEAYEEAPVPITGNWSNYFYSGWQDVMPRGNFFSPYRALYLPGDPDWTGVWGSIPEITDNKAYSVSFMYTGKLQFSIYIGRDLKYPLDLDPKGIVPSNATLVDGAIHWDLDVSDWTEFSYAFEIDTWLADSAITSPSAVGFEFVGVLEWDVSGYVDDFKVLRSVNGLGTEPSILRIPEVTNTYELIETQFDSTFITEVVDTNWTVDPLSLVWDLPASEEWSQFNYSWTNPTGDIGGTLTMVISATGAETDTLTWFDDFYFGAPQVGIRDIDNIRTIDVYPNPAYDVIRMNSSIEMKRAVFYNSVGQMVRTINKPEKQINISAFSEGLYFLQLTDKDGNEYRAKFIKR